MTALALLSLLLHQAEAGPGATRVGATVTHAEIQQAVAPVLPRLMRCYQKSLTRDGPNPGGAVVLDVRVAADGKPKDVTVHERVGTFSESLRACFTDAARRGLALAPRPSGEVRIRLPLSLEAR
jgi:hypothetical protein